MRHDLYPTAMNHTSAPFLIALLASAAVALAAWWARSLSVSGALAATFIGTAATAVSYEAGAFVIAWFALASILSRIGKGTKTRHVGGIVEKSSQRDAWQVLANGGVFAVLLAIHIFAGPQCNLIVACDRIVVVAAAALAAAGADTWATELGTLFGGTPWSVRTRERVPTGTSGAVTLAGIGAMLAGAFILAFLANVLGLAVGTRAFLAVAVGGVAGALSDTLLGAWVQERRWCPRCSMETEQRTHRCGTNTVHHRGVRGLNNDAVNFLCTCVGAVVALLLVLA